MSGSELKRLNPLGYTRVIVVKGRAMPRYYFHLKEGSRLIEDEEGQDLPNLSAARDLALTSMRGLLGESIRFGEDIRVDALVVADDRGNRLAAVPMAAALPSVVIEELKAVSENGRMDKAEEYRQSAQECRRMAENAISPDDKAAWLRLADAWLHMLPQDQAAEGWPKPTGQDSEASH